MPAAAKSLTTPIGVSCQIGNCAHTSVAKNNSVIASAVRRIVMFFHCLCCLNFFLLILSPFLSNSFMLPNFNLKATKSRAAMVARAMCNSCISKFISDYLKSPFLFIVSYLLSTVYYLLSLISYQLSSKTTSGRVKVWSWASPYLFRLILAEF